MFSLRWPLYRRFEALSGSFQVFAFITMLASSWMAIGSPAIGASGTWNSTTGGLWSTSANWTGSIIATGPDAVADFSTLDITSDETVHLDSVRTVGGLVFGDT